MKTVMGVSSVRPTVYSVIHHLRFCSCERSTAVFRSRFSIQRSSVRSYVCM